MSETTELADLKARYADAVKNGANLLRSLLWHQNEVERLRQENATGRKLLVESGRRLDQLLRYRETLVQIAAEWPKCTGDDCTPFDDGYDNGRMEMARIARAALAPATDAPTPDAPAPQPDPPHVPAVPTEATAPAAGHDDAEGA